eukprot:1071478-Prymnesium_polylepis.1
MLPAYASPVLTTHTNGLTTSTFLGNKPLNEIWLASLPASPSAAISLDVGAAQREAFIRRKYVTREFVGSVKP